MTGTRFIFFQSVSSTRQPAVAARMEPAACLWMHAVERRLLR
jgi:hypothetical protein